MKFIKSKIFSHLFSPIIFVVVSYFLITNFALNRVFYDYIEQDARQNVRNFSATVVDHFLAQDQIGMTGHLFEEKYSGLPVEYIVVFDQNKELFAHTYLGKSVRANPSTHLSDLESNQVQHQEQGGKKIYNVDFPVRVGLQTIGLVRVGYDLSGLQSGVVRVAYAYGFLFLATLLLVAILAARLSRLIIEPISELTDSVAAFTQGKKFKRIEKISNDEIGELSQAFNNMAQSIEESQWIIEQEKEKTQAKIEELEKWQRLAVDRELKMIELKKVAAEIKKDKKV